MPAKGAGSREVGRYITDLYDAHDDCYAKLGAVKGLVKR